MDLRKILDTTPEPPIIEPDIANINYSGDYQLPTPMYDFQKELTDQIVSLHYPDILKYCELNDRREIIIKSLDICLENCQLVSNHPYLLIDHYMPKNLTFKQLPEKLAETSGKFNVFKDLINVLIDDKNNYLINVGVVINNKRNLFDLIDALLLGCSRSNNNVTVIRYSGNNVLRESKKKAQNKTTTSNSSTTTSTTTATTAIATTTTTTATKKHKKKHATKEKGYGKHKIQNHSVTIHLIPHDGQISKGKPDLKEVKFDLLIVFDGSVDTESDFFKLLRIQNRNVNINNNVNDNVNDNFMTLNIKLDRGRLLTRGRHLTRGRPSTKENLLVDKNSSEESIINLPPCAIIRLIPTRTVEHAKLYYKPDEDKPDYLTKVISSIVCLRDSIGQLPPDIYPIYHQKLTYFSHTFFDKLFQSTTMAQTKINGKNKYNDHYNDEHEHEHDHIHDHDHDHEYPGWPLPDLPKIIKFSPYDVERSLLTETRFHYTPYDFNPNHLNNENSSKDYKNQLKSTYYELKRLQLEYITNPLKNSYDVLTGIYRTTNNDAKILTHKLILQLNEAFMKRDRLNKELETYNKFHNNDWQINKIGRRDHILKSTKKSIEDDINQCQIRINNANKSIDEKTQELESIKLEIKQLQLQLENFKSKNPNSSSSSSTSTSKTKATTSENENNSKRKRSDDDDDNDDDSLAPDTTTTTINTKNQQFIDEQFKIWELQEQINDYIHKIELKNNEKQFAFKEYENCLKSIDDSNKQIEHLIDQYNNNKRKFDELIEKNPLNNNNNNNNQFEIEKQKLITKIKDQEIINESLKFKLNNAFTFLNDTKYLKKRKNRGITPK